MALSYPTLTQLHKSHPAWRLLRAEHAPLIISFIDKVFIQPNLRTIDQPTLISKLDDILYQLRETEGSQSFTRSAQEYLNDWAHSEKGWLRKFYPIGSDEPHYDLTPATEKVLSWLESLTSKTFIGTESRLLTIFELLRQMVLGAEADADTRIKELEKRKREIDQEIESIRKGEVSIMNETALRDRFLQVNSTAKELLSDFRAVEDNFRMLDNQVREQIATWEGTKGALLERIFGEHDAITDSDQGCSFRAFWDFLMSQQSQDELSELLEKILSFDAIKNFVQDKKLKRIHYDWLAAGEHTQRTVASLSQQLRRYLDNQAYLENKRIMQILDSISHNAIIIKNEPPKGNFMTIDEPSPSINLPMERPLYTPPIAIEIDSLIHMADGTEVDSTALYNQTYIDKTQLEKNINKLLQNSSQVTLYSVIQKNPLTKGLAELVTYIAIAGSDRLAVFDDTFKEIITWQNANGIDSKATIPRIIFNRK